MSVCESGASGLFAEGEGDGLNFFAERIGGGVAGRVQRDVGLEAREDGGVRFKGEDAPGAGAGGVKREVSDVRADVRKDPAGCDGVGDGAEFARFVSPGKAEDGAFHEGVVEEEAVFDAADFRVDGRVAAEFAPSFQRVAPGLSAEQPHPHQPEHQAPNPARGAFAKDGRGHVFFLCCGGSENAGGFYHNSPRLPV